MPLRHVPVTFVKKEIFSLQKEQALAKLEPRTIVFQGIDVSFGPNEQLIALLAVLNKISKRLGDFVLKDFKQEKDYVPIRRGFRNFLRGWAGFFLNENFVDLFFRSTK